MSTQYGANKYRQTAVTTASRGQILIMLYEAAIRHVRTAIAALEKKDIAAKGQAIVKAHDIINELTNTLNFEVGGDIAKNLERLYMYMTDLLIQANMKNEKAPLETVAKLMETLLDGWRVAIEQLSKNTKPEVEK